MQGGGVLSAPALPHDRAAVDADRRRCYDSSSRAAGLGVHMGQQAAAECGDIVGCMIFRAFDRGASCWQWQQSSGLSAACALASHNNLPAAAHLPLGWFWATAAVERLECGMRRSGLPYLSASCCTFAAWVVVSRWWVCFMGCRLCVPAPRSAFSDAAGVTVFRRRH